MKNLNEMIAKRNAIVAEMKRICDVAETRENQKMTIQEAEKWTSLNNEQTAINDEIKREKQMQDLIAGLPSSDQPEDSATKKFTFGEFAQMTAQRSNYNLRSRFSETELRAAGMSEGVPSEGGYLVQTQHAQELLKRTYEIAVVSSKCRKLPIGDGFNSLTINAIDETSRVTGSRWGGVRGYWMAEGGTKLDSKPKLRQVQMVLQKLAAICYATDELIQDASLLEGLLMQAFSEEFGYMLDEAVIRGGGAGSPLGILNSPCLVTQNKEAGQLAATIVVENISKMWSRMYAPSRSNAIWLISQECEQELDTMALSVGFGGVPVYLPMNGISGAPYSTIKGRPVIPIEQCSALGTVGDIILADLNQYLLIEKGGIDQQYSIHVRFLYDETTYRFVLRVNGQPIWNAPLTPATGSSATVSPFVALQTRS